MKTNQLERNNSLIEKQLQSIPKKFDLMEKPITLYKKLKEELQMLEMEKNQMQQIQHFQEMLLENSCKKQRCYFCSQKLGEGDIAYMQSFVRKKSLGKKIAKVD